MERNEAIEVVRKNWPEGRHQLSEALKTLIPELKESEDERIKKALMWCVETIEGELGCYDAEGIAVAELKSWLEKQGEPKPVCKMQVSDELYEHIRNTCACIDDALSSKSFADINDYLSMAEHSAQSAFDMIEKQGEQKPADKDEPKFKVGDWITNGIDVDKIIGIDLEDENYLFENGGKSDISLVESISHIWTIQDSKDGDILMANAPFIFNGNLDGGIDCPGAYCAINTLGKFQIPEHPTHWTGHSVTPATKEQRDFLFQKIKEAGYEWDAEKRELRNVEQKQAINCLVDISRDNWEFVHEFVEKFGRIPKDEDELNALVEYVLKRQKPNTWSEEDERMIKEAIRMIAEPGSFFKGTALTEKVVSRLESLKERCTWKPSEKQMKILQYLCETSSHPNEEVIPTLESLYNDLKKL